MASRRVEGQIRGQVRSWLADLLIDAPYVANPTRAASSVADCVLADLHALLDGDPATASEEEALVHAGFKAVALHRVASAVDRGRIEPAHPNPRVAARAISEWAKIQTLVEIHPGASIGPRFVVDHGMGTVIGETAVIGSDCYILHGVLLGARGVASNGAGRRHPVIRSRVQIGAYCRVLGPVVVGHDSFLGAHTTITSDVPPWKEVVLKEGKSIMRDRLPAEIDRALPRSGS